MTAYHPTLDIRARAAMPEADRGLTPRLRTSPEACTFAAMKTDEDEARWDEQLTKVAKHKTAPEKPE